MDSLPRSDITRMAMAIEHEALAKIKDLKLRAVEKYEKVKAGRVEEGNREIEKQLREETRRLDAYKARIEGTIRNGYKKQILSIKQKKIDEILRKVRLLLADEPLRGALIRECIEGVGKNPLEQFYVATRDPDDMDQINREVERYAKERDKKELGKFSSGSWRELPESALGGIVLVARDGRLICDNSYETRLKIILEKHMQRVGRALDW